MSALAQNQSIEESSRGETTKELLLKTAMEIFARDGFAAASTRQIAETAGVNLALISYHFGSKHGLYLAVFEYIVELVRKRLGNGITALQGLVANRNAKDEDIMSGLSAYADSALEFLLSQEMTAKAALILREQQFPTEAFDIVYNGFMKPMIETLTQLVSRLRPDLDQQKLNVTVISFFTQVIGLRAARTAVTRFMNWDEISVNETAQLKAQVEENFKTLIKYGGKNA